MKHLKTWAAAPALTRRDALTAIGIAMVSATALGSSHSALEAPRGSTNNRGRRSAARQESAPFVLSF